MMLSPMMMSPICVQRQDARAAPCERRANDDIAGLATEPRCIRCLDRHVGGGELPDQGGGVDDGVVCVGM